MSKLTDIKSRIDQLDGGAFQNFCDAYLSCRDYKNGYSLGMNKRCVKSGQGLYFFRSVLRVSSCLTKMSVI